MCFMIIESAININMMIDLKKKNTINNPFHLLECKQHVKHLSVTNNKTVTLKYHISLMCTGTSHNTGIVSKFRHSLYIQQFFCITNEK